MPKPDNTRFVRMALNLRLIDLGEFNQIMELWEKDPTKDSGQLMLDKGFLSKDQYKKILSMFSNSNIRQNFEVTNSKFIKNKDKSVGDVAGVDSFDNEEILYADSFSLKGVLGQGGVGCVFLCFDRNIGREVAIKEVVEDEAGSSSKARYARFIREAKITGQLEHPGIVPVYELNAKEDGTVYYVMKHVKGRTLFQAIKECSASTAEEEFQNRMKLFDKLINICEAMSYAHSRDIIHRDLKPSNVILGEFGETIILDWGTAKNIMAKDLEDSRQSYHLQESVDEDAELTKHGELLGTPSYMSPEQIDSKFGSVDLRSDVFSLGTILYILLTGKKPYRGTAKEIMSYIARDEDSPAPGLQNKFVPSELDAICRKAMSKKKDDRFSDASELLKELKAFRDGRLVSVYSYSKRELFKRFVKRNKVVLTAAAAVVMAIVVGAGFALNFAIEAQHARKRAERALVDVSEFSESALSVSRNSVKELNYGFNALVVGMKQAAANFSNVNLSKVDAVEPKLKELKGQFEGVEGWAVIVSPGTITAIYPPREKKSVLTPQEYKRIIDGLQTRKDYISDIITVDKNVHLFLMHVPIHKGKSIAGLLTAVIMPDTAIPLALSFDPEKSDYQVWCMNKDGYILYDEDESQIGKDLFTDEMYAKYPELLSLGERMMKDPWGVGYYKFIDSKTSREVYKIAAWDTFSPVEETNWKIVITYPYSSK